MSSACFPPQDFFLMYIHRICVPWQFFGVLENNLLCAGSGLCKVPRVKSSGSELSLPRCLLGNEWKACALPAKADLVVCRDHSNSSERTWIKQSLSASFCFDQRHHCDLSSCRSSVVFECDSSCIQGIDFMHTTYQRLKLNISSGDPRLRSAS